MAFLFQAICTITGREFDFSATKRILRGYLQKHAIDKFGSLYRVHFGGDINAISQTNSTQERILELLKINSKITRKELANALNKTPDSIKHHLQQLTKKGIIKHIGSTKAGEWLIL